MDKPVEFEENSTLDAENAAPLVEGDNPEEENLAMSGIVGWVESRFNQSSDSRMGDEERWLRAYRNYRGIYGPETQFTSSEKSKAFIKITKTKVLAAYNQVVDVLFAGSRFPIGVENPSTSPIGVEDAVSFDPAAPPKSTEGTNVKRKAVIDRVGTLKDILAPVAEQLAAEPGVSATSVTYEPAKEMAKKMEEKIHQQLDETEASKHLRHVAFEMSLFGCGIIKAPFAFEKEYPKWDKNGDYKPEFETIPKVESVSIWDFYPDPDARSMSDAEYVIQRHRMNRTQLRGLRKRPHFREESLEIAVEMGENYTNDYWEETLQDNSSSSSSINRYEVLEYWGVLDAETAQEAEIELPEEFLEQDEVQVNIWVCNGQILRLVVNPFTPTRIPYSAVPYEVNPYSFFGVGLAENMEDTQEVMNGFMRMAVDNAALSSNLLIEIDETNLVPGQDLSVYPGKIFRRQAGAPGQAIFGTKFPNVTGECLQMFDKARQLADESTGMPSYAHGMTGVQGVGRTASGMSMLMGAAAQNIKSVVRNIDDFLLSPMGKALFAFNMQFSFDKEIAAAPLNIVARGTESLMRNEVRSQRLLNFMQMTANPMMSPFIKYDYMLRELASSMDLDDSKILNDPRQAAVQAKMMAEIQALMPAPEGAPQGAAQGEQAPQDPTGNGGGQIVPGNAPEPGAPGNTNGESGPVPSPPTFDPTA